MAAVRVSLLVTCTVDLLEPEVGEATVRVLRAAGCEVTVALGQTCCGQPGWNTGHVAEAAEVARTTMTALEAELAEGAEWVVVPAGSCATMVRIFWPELFTLAGDEAAADRARRVGERTRELSELLEHLDLPPLVAAPSRVGYHHSCHMLRELRVREAPERLVDRVDGVERVPGTATTAAAASAACSR